MRMLQNWQGIACMAFIGLVQQLSDSLVIVIRSIIIIKLYLNDIFCVRGIWSQTKRINSGLILKMYSHVFRCYSCVNKVWSVNRMEKWELFLRTIIPRCWMLDAGEFKNTMFKYEIQFCNDYNIKLGYYTIH